jgi:hypothetical protein
MYGVPADLAIHRFVGGSLESISIGVASVHFNFGSAGTISVAGIWQLHDRNGTLVDEAQEHESRDCYRVHVILNADVSSCSLDPPRSFSLVFSTGHRLEVVDDTPQYESCIIYFKDGTVVYI